LLQGVCNAPVKERWLKIVHDKRNTGVLFIIKFCLDLGERGEENENERVRGE
jgi:hypothetical protein